MNTEEQTGRRHKYDEPQRTAENTKKLDFEVVTLAERVYDGSFSPRA
jgi:hypothetical protein